MGQWQVAVGICASNFRMSLKEAGKRAPITHSPCSEERENIELFGNFVNHLECPLLRRFPTFRDVPPKCPLPSLGTTVSSPALPILCPQLAPWAPLPCPFYPPNWQHQPCLPMHPSLTELLFNWPPPLGLSLTLTSPGSLPDHPDEVRYPPNTVSLEHPLLTLLITHVQCFTTACSPVPPSPEYQVLEDRNNVRQFAAVSSASSIVSGTQNTFWMNKWTGFKIRSWLQDTRSLHFTMAPKVLSASMVQNVMLDS